MRPLLALLLALPALAAEPGRLRVNVAPAEAVVRIDGQVRATGDLPPTELPAGVHNVDVSLEGHVEARHVVEVKPGATACLAISLARVPRPGKDPSDVNAREVQSVIAASTIAGVAAGVAGRPPLELEDPHAERPLPATPPPRLPPPPAPSASTPPWEVAAPCP